MGNLLTFNSPMLEELTEQLALQRAEEASDRALRQMFDNSATTCHAKGVIRATVILGRIDLATEMQSDLDEIMSQGREVA